MEREIRSAVAGKTGYFRFEPRAEQPQAEVRLRDEADDDKDDVDEDDLDKDNDEDGDEEEEEETLFNDFGGERKALIFKAEEGDATRSYSSMRLTRSSSEVIETRTSRSSAGN